MVRRKNAKTQNRDGTVAKRTELIACLQHSLTESHGLPASADVLDGISAPKGKWGSDPSCYGEASVKATQDQDYLAMLPKPPNFVNIWHQQRTVVKDKFFE